MKYELYNNKNKITEDKYKLIYRIIIDNYFIRNPHLLNNKDRIDNQEAYNNWINTILNTPNYNILILYDNNNIIGFVSYMYDKGYLCLSEVQIKEEYKGLGYLKKMLKEVIINSNQYKYDIVYGTINKNNKKSQEIFSHIGMINIKDNRYEISKNKLEKWLNI